MNIKYPDVRWLCEGFTTNRGTIMAICPRHKDNVPSMEVSEGHTFCHAGCGYLRRYASIALLLGLWNGKPETERQAVLQLTSSSMLEQLIAKGPYTRKGWRSSYTERKGLSGNTASTFHRFLLSQSDTLSYFLAWRGLSYDTVIKKKLGYTGTHFTIPIYDTKGKLVSIRYRADDRLCLDGPKYSGIVGHNQVIPYDISNFYCTDTVWVTEGEYDALILSKWVDCVVTLTNGAGRLRDLPDKLSAIDSGILNSKWVLATDQDEAGEKAAYELKQILGKRAVRARWSMGKDMTEYIRGGGDLDSIAYIE